MPLPRRLTALALAAALGLAAGACSSDDDSSDSSDDAPTTIAPTGDNGSSEAGSGEASLDDIDDETWVNASISALESQYPEAQFEEEADGTVRVTFPEGSVDDDGIMTCVVISGVLGDTASAVVVYPDGEKSCD